MKDYIVKTNRSLRAECLPRGFQVLYLFDCMKTREPWTNSQEVWIQRNERYRTDKEKSHLWIEVFFPKINFVTCRSSCCSSCYRIESRTTARSKPWEKGVGGGSLKKLFSALRAPVWSKNKRGGGWGRPPGPLPWIRHWELKARTQPSW